jgi:RHS repeat-associated protein
MGCLKLSYHEKKYEPFLRVAYSNFENLSKKCTKYYPFGLVMSGISSKAANSLENKYKYNGIEQNNDFDINTYDAFYRTNDPQIGRWWQIDPKVEAFYALTPYNSMGNNPIKFNDPLGDEFDEDSQKIIDALKKTIASRQSELNTQRKDLKQQITDAKKAGDKDLVKSLNKELKAVNSMRSEMSSAQSEIRTMEKSEQLFRIKEFSGDKPFGNDASGVTTYSSSDKAVVMAFTNNNYNVLIHELKHGYDFLIGEISFTPNANFDYKNPTTYFNKPEDRISSLHDMNDEYRAFDRTAAYIGQTYSKEAVYNGYQQMGYNLSLTSKNLSNTTPPKKEVYFKTHKN